MRKHTLRHGPRVDSNQTLHHQSLISLCCILTVLQVGFEDRGVSCRALFVWPTKNEGNMCHVMCLEARHVMKYNLGYCRIAINQFILGR